MKWKRCNICFCQQHMRWLYCQSDWIVEILPFKRTMNDDHDHAIPCAFVGGNNQASWVWFCVSFEMVKPKKAASLFKIVSVLLLDVSIDESNFVFPWCRCWTWLFAVHVKARAGHVLARLCPAQRFIIQHHGQWRRPSRSSTWPQPIVLGLLLRTHGLTSRD